MVPSANQPLSAPMLTPIHVAKCRHLAGVRIARYTFSEILYFTLIGGVLGVNLAKHFESGYGWFNEFREIFKLVMDGGWGWRLSLRWWSPSNMCVSDSCNLFKYHRRDIWIIPYFEFGLCATFWARFMCHQEVWPTSVNHSFSFPNNSLCLAGRKHYHKIYIPIFRLLQNFALPGRILYILLLHLFSLFSSGCFVFAQCGSTSVQGTS